MPAELFAWGVSPQEMWPILLVIIVLFGAKKLPELARGMGEGMKEFKKAVKEVNAEDTSREGEANKPADSDKAATS
jgi:sec-independent protein translocase protein TatA